MTYLRLFLLVFITSVTSWSFGQQPEQAALFSSGKWMKIETSQTGIHRLSYSWLKNTGFSHPEKVKVFAAKNKELLTLNSLTDGNSPLQIPVFSYSVGSSNESILLYAGGPVEWSLNTLNGKYQHHSNSFAQGKSIFYLTEDTGSELPLENSPLGSTVADQTVTSYDDYALFKEEKYNLLESGAKWFSLLLQGNASITKNFSFPDRSAGDELYLTAEAAGRSISASNLSFSMNGSVIGTLPFAPVQPSGTNEFAVSGSFSGSAILSGDELMLNSKYNASATDQCWIDYFSVQVRRKLNYRGSPLLFRDSRSIGNGKVAKFIITGANSGLELWDISNVNKPVRIGYQFSNGQLSFSASTEQLRNFILFDPASDFPAFLSAEIVPNENILSQKSPEFLIISPSAFSDQAIRLADYHRSKDQMDVAVISVEAIFNEFSGGYRDPSAIRNFIRGLYQQKNGSGVPNLKYVLLFGKGTYDPVHAPDVNNPDWIPTKQSDNSLHPVNSFVSDDFFGLLEEGEGNFQGSVDIGIGRIPAINSDEAKIAVDKIVGYQAISTLGDWRNSLSFIGDDEDNNLHVHDSETLATLLNQTHPEYKTEKIYFDAFKEILTPEQRYPDVTEAIYRSVHRGDLIVNYVGHANEDGLAHEKVLSIKDIDQWSNKNRLPLFVTATCEFSRWDMTMKRSAGEHLLFHPAGGAIALLSATRLVYSASNFEINKSFINHVFEKGKDGKYPRLGDLIRMVKNENGGTDNTLKFCLLGDPALRLNYPEYECVTTSINGTSSAQFAGVVSPLGLVTVQGEIRNSGGQRMTGTSGLISAIVYDQQTGKTTLGNGGSDPFNYSVRENILFNGSVSVKNGSFSYSFTVPKDVNYDTGTGLIRYYWSDGILDGNGSFAKISFNGGAQINDDKTGPEVKLFLDNEQFLDGGKVSKNPLLMVYLKDESGINTSGIGIGHDISVQLDGMSASQVLLNEYYKTDAGSWKSGSLTYQLTGLAPGEHNLQFKVWDNANNSTSISIRFIVSEDLIIREIGNYPNPFSSETKFVIRHNQYGGLFDVTLEVFDLNGRLVYSKQQPVASDGYEITDLLWNPLITSPVPAQGLFMYRITLRDQDGRMNMHSGRLIWK